MSERRRPRNPGINLPKVSPRNPVITLPKISLLLLLLSASTIPCQVGAARAANLAVAAALLAAPAQPAAAQSPLLAPFNLFKTFFKNNPLRQERKL